MRSALKLGHARGVALLAAVGGRACRSSSTRPAEIKRAVVGYGRAEKQQVQQMVKLLLGLDSRRRRTTWPTRSPWRSATCTAAPAPVARRRSRQRRRPRRAIVAATIDLIALTCEYRRRDRAPPRHARSRRLPAESIVDVGGVGYDVQVPLSTFYVLGEPAPRSRCASTRTCARTSIALYGFATALEQDLFERLISISGIGPKLALRSCPASSRRS